MCNGDWEHQYGVHLETLDNPGWHISIDLSDTDLEDKPFTEISYGVGEESEPDDENWITCRVKEKTFHGYGGPNKLDEIITLFLEWEKPN